MWIWIVLVLVVAGLAYVRLAPSDPQRWHVAAKPGDLGEKKLEGGYIWREAVTDGTDKLGALDKVARATARTDVLNGSVEEGKITYVTRSRAFGFPDYTTIGVYEAPDKTRYLEIYARLRFGKSDLGVNAQRVKGWLAAIK